MKITIICGSPRAQSQSMKVSRVIQQQLQALAADARIFSLRDNPIPLWEEAIWDGDQKWKDLLAPIKQQMTESDGFVVVSPEYHGQVPATLKNFFLMFNRFELGHKPAQIVAVSSADGGSYPVAELRMSSYKNNRICYIPDHLIIRNVEKVLNSEAEKNNPDADAYFRERIEWSSKVLLEYARALKTLRQKDFIHSDKFANGM